jgi:hypothetical protein
MTPYKCYHSLIMQLNNVASLWFLSLLSALQNKHCFFLHQTDFVLAWILILIILRMIHLRKFFSCRKGTFKNI